MKAELLKEYNVELDKKNRMTVRGKLGFNNYHVSVFKDGKIVMEPRYLARLDELSEKTLRMIDESAKNLEKGLSGKPVDFSEFREVLDEE
jgi:tRNA(Phe) wybutosine-synthesizing methylase Tyw3